MRVIIQKWGNSLAIRIPKSFAVETNLTRGSAVDLKLEDGKLIAVPITEKKYTLKELLAAVSEDNIHGEFDSGDVSGKETW